MRKKETLFQLSEHFHYRVLPNGKIRAFNSISGKMLEVDGSAAVIWGLLKKKQSLQDLQAQVLKKYPKIFNRSSAKALPTFIENCIELDMIEISTAP